MWCFDVFMMIMGILNAGITIFMLACMIFPGLLDNEKVEALYDFLS